MFEIILGGLLLAGFIFFIRKILKDRRKNKDQVRDIYPLW